MIFLKEIFGKEYFVKKNQQMTIHMKKYPACKEVSGKPWINCVIEHVRKTMSHANCLCIGHLYRLSGKSATIRESNHGLGVCMEHYV